MDFCPKQNKWQILQVFDNLMSAWPGWHLSDNCLTTPWQLFDDCITLTLNHSKIDFTYNGYNKTTTKITGLRGWSKLQAAKNKFLIACSVALRVMQKDTSRDEKTVSILVPSVASSTKALIPNRISETLLIFKNVLHGQERPDDERYYIISFHIYEFIFVW